MYMYVQDLTCFVKTCNLDIDLGYASKIYKSLNYTPPRFFCNNRHSIGANIIWSTAYIWKIMIAHNQQL